MPASFAPLPIRQFSLSQFCDKARRLLVAERRFDFAQFVLTGIHRDTQAEVKPVAEVYETMPRDHPLSIRRYYGSAYAVHEDVLVNAPITLIFMPHFKNPLNNIQVDVSFINGEVSHCVPVHTVPHLCLGGWNTDNVLHAVITGLYDPDHPSAGLTEQQYKTFVQMGYWPAVLELMGDAASDWLHNIDKGTQGPVQPLKMTSYLAPLLTNSIRHHLQSRGVSWSEGLYILHQIPGNKVSTSHKNNATDAREAFSKFLSDNGILQLDMYSKDWFVDVGLEISSDLGECLAWRTDSHADLLECITGVAKHQAVLMTQPGSIGFTRDMISHMPALSGFRLTPDPSQRGYFCVQYLQIFINDKSVTSRNREACEFTGLQFVSGEASSSLRDMYDTYRMASLQESTSACVEMRIPFSAAQLSLIYHTISRQWLAPFPKSVWWDFHAYRALAFYFIFIHQSSCPAHDMLYRPVLLLAAAAPWFLHSLHSIPDQSHGSRDLLTAILPHEYKEPADPNCFPFPMPSDRPDNATSDDSGASSNSDTDSDIIRPGVPYVRNFTQHHALTVPSCPFGVLFLRPIRFGLFHPVPRFMNQKRFIKDDTFRDIFGHPFHEFTEDFLRTLRELHSKPRSNAAGSVRKPPGFVPLGQYVEGAQHELLQRLRATLSEAVTDLSDLSDEEPPEPTVFLDDESEIIWDHFLRDLIAQSPNIKSEPPSFYCRLNADQRSQVNEATYMQSDLSVVWRAVQWKIGTNSDHNTNFDTLFPERRARPASKLSEYRLTRYYPIYIKFINRAGPRAAQAIRNRFRKQYDRLFWVPQAQLHVIWATRNDPLFDKLGTSDHGLYEESPRILVRAVPTWFGNLQ